MRIAEIGDPSFFQRLVRKLMICEHGVEYQAVDDSGGDGGSMDLIEPSIEHGEPTVVFLQQYVVYSGTHPSKSRHSETRVVAIKFKRF